MKYLEMKESRGDGIVSSGMIFQILGDSFVDVVTIYNDTKCWVVSLTLS